jgi:ketosteroid isomerase-like protein
LTPVGASEGGVHNEVDPNRPGGHHMATKTKPDLTVERTEHANATRMREAFDAFSRGDLDAVHATFADNCTWTNQGTSPLAGEYRGWDQIQGMFGKLFELTDGTFSMNVHTIVADEKCAVAIYDSTSTVKGVTDTQRTCLVDEFDAKGKVTATHLFAYDQAAGDAHLNR